MERGSRLAMAGAPRRHALRDVPSEGFAPTDGFQSRLQSRQLAEHFRAPLYTVSQLLAFKRVAQERVVLAQASSA